MQHIVTLKDKTFEPYISEQEILNSVKVVAQKINCDLKDSNPLFLVVLNGSFMFAADLLREITIPCEVSFVKLKSYEKMSSSGDVTEMIGLSEDVKDRVVVIVEDIVDTGNTIEKLVKLLTDKKVKKISISTLLYKPSVYKKNIKLDYIGVEIPNNFVVGYGLDYDGLGRNLKQLYTYIPTTEPLVSQKN